MPWQSPSKSTCDATQASASGVSYRRTSGRAAAWPAGLILTRCGHRLCIAIFQILGYSTHQNEAEGPSRIQVEPEMSLPSNG